METPPTHQPSQSLLWFARLLRLLAGLLLVVTPLVVLLGAHVASGRGTLHLLAELEPPYSIGLDPSVTNILDVPGRRIDVGDGGTTAYVSFPQGEERALFVEAPSVRADVVVSRDDRDTRVLAVVLVLGWLALAWVGLENLRRVVVAAVEGEPFHERNVGRLRWVGATVLLFPALSQVCLRLIDRSLDAAVPLSPVLRGTPWWVLAVIGMGLLALAEVFRVGAELHELEQSTV